MKVSLNEKTTSKVIELLDCFPEGTKLTHVINLALTELYNKLGIGTQMQHVKIPQLTVSYAHRDNEINADNPQGYPINNSHILKYLGISGGA